MLWLEWCSEAVRWPWQTVDAKKIILMSRYYKRIGQNQTTHLRVCLLILHMKKRNFPWATPLPTRLVDPASDFIDLGYPGREKPSPFCSQWLCLSWAHMDMTPKGNSCGGAQDPPRVSRGISEPNPVAPQHPPPRAGHSWGPQASPPCKITPEPVNNTTVACDLQVAAHPGCLYQSAPQWTHLCRAVAHCYEILKLRKHSLHYFSSDKKPRYNWNAFRAWSHTGLSDYQKSLRIFSE